MTKDAQTAARKTPYGQQRNYRPMVHLVDLKIGDDVYEDVRVVRRMASVTIHRCFPVNEPVYTKIKGEWKQCCSLTSTAINGDRLTIKASWVKLGIGRKVSRETCDGGRAP